MNNQFNQCDASFSQTPPTAPLAEAAPPVLSALVNDICQQFGQLEFDYVVGVGNLGLILGKALAHGLGLGFSHIPKNHFGARLFELGLDGDHLLPEGSRVLLVGRAMHTGAEVNRLIQSLETLGIKVVAMAAINLDQNETTGLLLETSHFRLL